MPPNLEYENLGQPIRNNRPVLMIASDDESNIGLDDQGGLVSDDELGNVDDVDNDAGPEGNDLAEENEPKPVEPKKKRVKNPRPKLDIERLKGPRGLMAVHDYFKDFKPRKGGGRANLLANLEGIIQRYEHWAHRLFPQYTFDDCLAHLEDLGQKKEVKVLMHKIRTDTFVVEDNIHLFNDDDENDKPFEMDVDNPPEAVFDTLINNADLPPLEAILTPREPNPLAPLTPAQVQRMEQNRQIAKARLLARRAAEARSQ